MKDKQNIPLYNMVIPEETVMVVNDIVNTLREAKAQTHIPLCDTRDVLLCASLLTQCQRKNSKEIKK